MQVEQHLAALREAVDAFATSATTAGLEEPVPTTPDWDVRRLVAHQGVVHRWATGQLRGERLDPDAVEREGLDAEDPVAWLRLGADRLVEAIRAAPDEPEALAFQAGSPTPNHAVDALSAELGRYPRAADTRIGTDVALDGIDELLSGLLPRPHSHVRADEPMTIAVLPEDADERWLVAVSRQAPVTTRGLGDEEADVVLRGPTVALYLALWNRSDEIRDESLDLWAEGARATWG